MKLIFLNIFLLSLTVTWSQNINREDSLGHKQGQWHFYDSINQLSFVEMYVNDTLHGYVATFDNDMNRKSIHFFHKGKLFGRSIIYNEKEIKRAILSYKNDQLNGSSETYYDNGKLESKHYFENDTLNGESTTYYKNGLLQTKVTYIKELPHGTYLQYSKKGRIEVKASFIYGIEQDTTFIYNKHGNPKWGFICDNKGKYKKKIKYDLNGNIIKESSKVLEESLGIILSKPSYQINDPNLKTPKN